MLDRLTTDLYFEAHVTIDPVEGDRLDRFKEIAEANTFRVANLLMQKGDELTPSNIDAFCTARSTEFKIIEGNLNELVYQLLNEGFKIRRWKIENTLIDFRCGD